MRYRLPTDRLINQLVPHYLPGRKYILFLQSLVYPLQTLNERFVAFAKEKRIEARMTSQTMYFEWYLNHKFGKYLLLKEENIYLDESGPGGVDIYRENAQNAKPFTVWQENELVAVVNPEENPREFYLLSEETAIDKVSFKICVPEITISEKEFVYMLSHTVNTYRIAGKTYLIKMTTKQVNE